MKRGTALQQFLALQAMLSMPVQMPRARLDLPVGAVQPKTEATPTHEERVKRRTRSQQERRRRNKRAKRARRKNRS